MASGGSPGLVILFAAANAFADGETLRLEGAAEESFEEVRRLNQSLSTSGNYEKFFWPEGKLYSHIMDPRTGYPPKARRVRLRATTRANSLFLRVARSIPRPFCNLGAPCAWLP